MPSSPSLTSRLEALLGLARVVRGESDLRAVLAQVVDTVAELLHVRSVVLNLHRPAWDDFLVTDVHGSAAAREALLGTTSLWSDWKPLPEHQFRRCGVYFVPAGAIDWNEHGPESYIPDAPETADEGAWHPEDALFARLEASDGRTLGILSVDEPASGRRVGDDDLRLLATVAAHAARAIEESQRVARARRRRRSLESLVAVSSEFGRDPDPARALQLTCEAIRDSLGFGVVTVTLIDDDGDLHRVAAVGVNLFERTLPLDAIKPVLDKRFFREGCYLVGPADIHLLSHSVPYHHSNTNGRGPHAWEDHALIVPLESHAGRLLGYLWADEPTDRLVPADDTLHALRTFGNQAAMALEVARRI